MSYSSTIPKNPLPVNPNAWFWSPKMQYYLKNPGWFARLAEWAGQYLETCDGKPLKSRVVTRLDPVLNGPPPPPDSWMTTVYRAMRVALSYIVKPIATFIHQKGLEICPLQLFRRFCDFSDNQIFVGHIEYQNHCDPEARFEGRIYRNSFYDGDDTYEFLGTTELHAADGHRSFKRYGLADSNVHITLICTGIYHDLNSGNIYLYNPLLASQPDPSPQSHIPQTTTAFIDTDRTTCVETHPYCHNPLSHDYLSPLSSCYWQVDTSSLPLFA